MARAGKASNNPDVCTGSCGCWIGLSDTFVEGGMVWSDGTTLGARLRFSKYTHARTRQRFNAVPQSLWSHLTI
jgi:hypothetical protein